MWRNGVNHFRCNGGNKYISFKFHVENILPHAMTADGSVHMIALYI